MIHFTEVVQRAMVDMIPYAATLRRCLNWGIPRNKAEMLADDGSAHAYAEAFRKQKQEPGYFTSESHFRAWITISADLYVRGELRRGNSGPTDLPPDLPDPKSPPAGEREDSPFRTCLSLLSEVQRWILDEQDDGKTHQQIALTLLKKSPEAIQFKPSSEPPTPNAMGLRVFRMVDQIRQHLEDCLKKHGISLYQRKRSRSLPA